MRLGRIMLMQLSINCHIYCCWFCCRMPSAATKSSRAAKRDVISYNKFALWITVDVYSIMLMTLQELCKSCNAFCSVILFYFGTNWHNACTTILVQQFYFILFQMGERWITDSLFNCCLVSSRSNWVCPHPFLAGCWSSTHQYARSTERSAVQWLMLIWLEHRCTPVYRQHMSAQLNQHWR